MTVSIRPVTREDVLPLIRLRVAPEQDRYVAPNAKSLAQLPYEPGAYGFGVWSAGRRIGFLSAIDTREHATLHGEDDVSAAYLWRLMIDRAHQHRGHGRAAMDCFFDWARDRRLPRAVTGVVEGNETGMAFYESLGFRPTGRVVEGEIQMARQLSDTWVRRRPKGATPVSNLSQRPAVVA